jgi:uncharacterized protein DUF5684
MQGMENANPLGALGTTFWIVWCVIIVFYIATMWKIFEKAGKPGWAAIIPIYNAIVILQIAGKPVWWIFLYLIPLVNIVIAIMVTVAFAANFGKGVGFAIGLILLGFIFYPILAFGEATYQPQPA